jgi:hypothetical protein
MYISFGMFNSTRDRVDLTIIGLLPERNNANEILDAAFGERLHVRFDLSRGLEKTTEPDRRVA